MPEDLRIIKLNTSNANSQEPRERSVTLEELEQLISEWVSKILNNLDPPPELWKRIKRQAKRTHPMENSIDI